MNNRHTISMAVATALACASVAGAAQAQTAADKTTQQSATAASRTDRDTTRFFEKAAIGGMTEVKLGELAEQKAASPAVKQFGATMVKDHGSANKALQQLAQQHSVKLPTALDREHQQTYDKLSRLSGSQFDHEYMSYMVKDHREDIELFEKQARKGEAADVKAFAEKTLPTLQEHLKMAQQAQAESGRTGSSPRR